MNDPTPSARRLSSRWRSVWRHPRGIALSVAALLVAAGLATAAAVVPRLLSGDPAATSSQPAPRTATDSSAVTLGADFTATGVGRAVGVRFLKASANTGAHTGALWDSSGTEIATATFVDETATGWQRAVFATPVVLHAGGRYTVSYFAPHGRYSYAYDMFAGGATQQFRATAETRGTFHYGPASARPTSMYRATTYFVAPIMSEDGVAAAHTAAPPAAGTPDGARLTPMGGTTISRPGTVLDARSISGQIVIDAPDVTISRSRLDGAGQYGILVLSGSVHILATTITGFRFGVSGDGYRADGVEVTGLSDDGFVLGSHTVVENSWCHGMEPEPGAHADCAQMQSGEVDVVVRNSYLDVGSELGNSAVFIAPDLGPDSDGPVTITGNVLGGGNYTLYCLDGMNGRYLTGRITIEGNRFLDTYRYGPMDVTVPAKLANNTFAGTGRPVLP